MNRGYRLGRPLPVSMLYSCLIPLTSIFRFLPKHFDPWILCLLTWWFVIKRAFLYGNILSIKKPLIRFWTEHPNSLPLPSATFFSIVLLLPVLHFYLFCTVSDFSKIFPTLDFRTRWSNSCTDVTGKGNFPYFFLVFSCSFS